FLQVSELEAGPHEAWAAARCPALTGDQGSKGGPAHRFWIEAVRQRGQVLPPRWHRIAAPAPPSAELARPIAPAPEHAPGHCVVADGVRFDLWLGGVIDAAGEHEPDDTEVDPEQQQVQDEEHL